MRIQKIEFRGEPVFIIGGTQLLENDIWQNIYLKKYIVNYRGVYQIFYCEAQKGFYGQKVIDKKGLARRGRYYAMTGSEINHLLDCQILRDF